MTGAMEPGRAAGAAAGRPLRRTPVPDGIWLEARVALSAESRLRASHRAFALRCPAVPGVRAQAGARRCPRERGTTRRCGDPAVGAPRLRLRAGDAAAGRGSAQAPVTRKPAGGRTETLGFLPEAPCPVAEPPCAGETAGARQRMAASVTKMARRAVGRAAALPLGRRHQSGGSPGSPPLAGPEPPLVMEPQLHQPPIKVGPPPHQPPEGCLGAVPGRLARVPQVLGSRAEVWTPAGTPDQPHAGTASSQLAEIHGILPKAWLLEAVQRGG